MHVSYAEVTAYKLYHPKACDHWDPSLEMSCCTWCTSRQMTGFVASLTAEDAKVRMATQLSLQNQLTVGVPWLVDTFLWQWHACRIKCVNNIEHFIT